MVKRSVGRDGRGSVKDIKPIDWGEILSVAQEHNYRQGRMDGIAIGASFGALAGIVLTAIFAVLIAWPS